MTDTEGKIQLSLRVHPALIAVYKALAHADHRSVTNYVERVLEQHVSTRLKDIPLERLTEEQSPQWELFPYLPQGPVKL